MFLFKKWNVFVVSWVRLFSLHSGENLGPTKTKRKNEIYEDPKPIGKKQKTYASVCVQTEGAVHITTVGGEPSKDSCSTDGCKNTVDTDKTLHMLTAGEWTSCLQVKYLIVAFMRYFVLCRVI